MTIVKYTDAFEWLHNSSFSGKILDMHLHSQYSDGGNLSESIKIAKRLDSGICVTDHAEIKGSLKACKEIFSIPSIEVTSFQCVDLLIYFESASSLKEFYNKFVFHKRIKEPLFQFFRLKLDTEEIIDAAKDLNGFISVAHPDSYFLKKSMDYFDKYSEFLNRIDAVEGINSNMIESKNKVTISWGRRIKKPLTAGSDAHYSYNVCKAFTCCEADTRSGFLECIRKGKNIIVGKHLSVADLMKTALVILRRDVKWRTLVGKQ